MVHRWISVPNTPTGHWALTPTAHGSPGAFLTASTVSAYRLQVAPDAAFDDLRWDTGWVASGDRTNVVYDGPPLDTKTRYHWRVRVRNNASTDWSDTWFETGIDDWAGQWIGPETNATDPDPCPAPALRTSFSLDAEPARARLYVASGGTYECQINGAAVGDARLDTGQTDYEERVLYAVHDVTDLLADGENAVGAVLGRERYAMTTENTWSWHDPPWKAPVPHLRLQLEIEDADGDREVVATGGHWRVADSATHFDSLYEGEVYDARDALEGWTEPGYDDSNWNTATVIDGPGGELAWQGCQPMREVATYDPVEITEPVEDIYVFDFGVMTAGWAELVVNGEEDAELTVTYGEKLHDDGTVDVEQDLIDGEIQTDTYVLSGDGTERWEPKFSYKGFRYVQVEGLSEAPGESLLTAKEIHTAIERGSRSSWESADDLLNQIHGNTRRALLNNHHSIPTDTPVYEKNGWTGDAQLTAEAALYNFDMPRFYQKWMADFADAQRENGEVPPIVPTSDWGYSDFSEDIFQDTLPGWDAAYVLMPWWTYRYCGDRRILEAHYEGMKDLVDFVGSYSEAGRSATDHIIDEGLGDWVAPGHGEIRAIPPEGPKITSTTYYHAMADTVAKIAGVLGHDDDRRAYAALATEVTEALNAEFLDEEEGVYRTGEVDEYRQTSNVFPLAFGLVPDEHVDAVVENLVGDVTETHDGHLNTGILGTKYLLPVLTDHGYVDTAYEVATQRDYPSWGLWIEQGATALYEMWEVESRTRDHHMFGSVDEWFYKHLAGIRPVEPGFTSVAVEPSVPSELGSVSATVDTVRGEVGAEWEQGETFTLSVAIPPGTDATVRVPKRGADLTVPEGATVEDDGDRWNCRVESGEWTFTVE